METRKLLILCASRSGSRYTSKFLAAHRIDIGHETIGKHGAIGWPYLADRPYIPRNGKRGAFVWDNKVHQVRHPLSVISSMQRHTDGMLGWIAKHHGFSGSRLRVIMQYFLEWNRRAESEAQSRYCVEDIREGSPAADRLLLFFGNPLRYNAYPTKTENKRKHTALSWGDLEWEDIVLSYSIMELAERYGYAVDPDKP